MDVDQTTSSLERAPLADKDVNQLVTDAIPEPGGDNEVLKPAMPAASTLPTSKELSPRPPPLPPRPESSTKQVNLPMMFGMCMPRGWGYTRFDLTVAVLGRQNDVSECMDKLSHSPYMGMRHILNASVSQCHVPDRGGVRYE